MPPMRHVCAALLLAVLASCDGGRPAEGEKPKVAVSIFPIYDVARRVAGDRLDVVLVLPPGRSEHGYDPTPREMARVSGARLGVVVGLEMDPWAERIIRSAAGEGVEMLRLGPELDPRRHSAPEVGVDVVAHARAHHDEDEEGEEHEGEHHEEGEEHQGEHHEEGEEGEEHEGEHHEGEEHEGEEHEGEGHDEHGHGHRHGAFDPHFWLDPVRMQRAVAQLVSAYCASILPAPPTTARAATRCARSSPACTASSRPARVAGRAATS
ncbi:MAG: metal ABC transporter substrate-binding protein [Sandaracinaceae bacterium]|nr:metal ABC transporter substrate-binding protein [Sandaracinaceae bacterium]